MPAAADPPGTQSVYACRPPAPHPAASVDPRSAAPGCETPVSHGPRLPSRNVAPAPAEGVIKNKKRRGRVSQMVTDLLSPCML